jgi:homoserine dehydrogenase
MANTRNAYIVQLGLGGVGRALLDQVRSTRESLAYRRGLRLEYLALADSSGAWFTLSGQPGLADPALRAALDFKKTGQRLIDADLPAGAEWVSGTLALLDRVGRFRDENVILVDVTASLEMQPLLLRGIQNGCGVVLANKRPLVGPLPEFRRLMQSGRLRHEATVGAGLPVIGTIRYLQETGDEVTAVEGSLSGTMGYLCARLEDGVAFSDALAEAKDLGYTEPDPREDLGGVDVARKALILARLLGWELELGAVEVEGLYPAEWNALTVAGFLDVCRELDSAFSERVEAARGWGEVLRYLAEVKDGRCRVGLRSIPAAGLLGGLKGTDNVVAIHSRRYARPLTVCGAGAGVEVTAAAVLEDMIQLAVEYRAEGR